MDRNRSTQTSGGTSKLVEGLGHCIAPAEKLAFRTLTARDEFWTMWYLLVVTLTSMSDTKSLLLILRLWICGSNNWFLPAFCR